MHLPYFLKTRMHFDISKMISAIFCQAAVHSISGRRQSPVTRQDRIGKKGIHGFGHQLQVVSRTFGRGLADNKFMPNGFDIYDKASGAVAFQEHFVSVSKVEANH
ncbi:MAG: hypothetical protein ABIL58_10995 [Pseudomonadota bacterium]